MINFANVKEWIISEGDVIRVTDSQNRVIWEKSLDYSEPFYVENISSSSETLIIKKSTSDAPTLTIEYSTDKLNWSLLGNTSTSNLSLTINSGSKLYLRCNTDNWTNNNTGSNNTILGCSKVGGNIASLLYGSNFTGEESTFPGSTDMQFFNLFYNNTNLKDASKLILPFLTLTPYCYSEMFKFCGSLLYAPELPALTLAKRSYEQMFTNCSLLISAPKRIAATTLAESCCNAMFWNCTSLAIAPELPAQTLVLHCYNAMFQDCTSINTIKCYATNYSVSDCTYRWLINASSTGTFYCKDSTIFSRDESGIPSGWTVVEV